MTRDDFFTLVKLRLNRSDADMDAILAAEVGPLQRTLERGGFYPWFLEKSASLSTTPSTPFVSLPSDFLRLQEEAPVSISGRFLAQKPLQFLEAAWEPEAQGQPSEFSLSEGKILLRPVPDAVYSILLRYYGREPVLDSNITNAWLSEAVEWFANEMCYIVAANYLEDYKKAERFKRDAIAARESLRVAHYARNSVKWEES